MANYQADCSLQNVRDAILRRDIKLSKRENKLFRHVFNNSRVDRELIYFENRLVIPKDTRQAVLNSIHSGHNGRDAMLGSVEEVCWPQINSQIVACAKRCSNCQKAGTTVEPIKKQGEFETIRIIKSSKWKDCFRFLGPFVEAPENRKNLLVAIDHFSAYPSLKFVKSTNIKGVEKFLLST